MLRRLSPDLFIHRLKSGQYHLVFTPISLAQEVGSASQIWWYSTGILEASEKMEQSHPVQKWNLALSELATLF
jgi:hypothetical protein